MILINSHRTVNADRITGLSQDHPCCTVYRLPERLRDPVHDPLIELRQRDGRVPQLLARDRPVGELARRHSGILQLQGPDGAVRNLVLHRGVLVLGMRAAKTGDGGRGTWKTATCSRVT